LIGSLRVPPESVRPSRLCRELARKVKFAKSAKLSHFSQRRSVFPRLRRSHGARPYLAKYRTKGVCWRIETTKKLRESNLSPSPITPLSLFVSNSPTEYRFVPVGPWITFLLLPSPSPPPLPLSLDLALLVSLHAHLGPHETQRER